MQSRVTFLPRRRICPIQTKSMTEFGPFWDEECLGEIGCGPLQAATPSLLDVNLLCDEETLDTIVPEPDLMPSVMGPPPMAMTPPPPQSPEPAPSKSQPTIIEDVSSSPLPNAENSTWRTFMDENCPLRKRVKVTVTPSGKRQIEQPSYAPEFPSPSTPKRRKFFHPSEPAGVQRQTILHFPPQFGPSSGGPRRLRIQLPHLTEGGSFENYGALGKQNTARSSGDLTSDLFSKSAIVESPVPRKRSSCAKKEPFPLVRVADGPADVGKDAHAASSELPTLNGAPHQGVHMLPPSDICEAILEGRPLSNFGEGVPASSHPGTGETRGHFSFDWRDGHPESTSVKSDSEVADQKEAGDPEGDEHVTEDFSPKGYVTKELRSRIFSIIGERSPTESIDNLTSSSHNKWEAPCSKNKSGRTMLPEVSDAVQAVSRAAKAYSTFLTSNNDVGKNKLMPESFASARTKSTCAIENKPGAHAARSIYTALVTKKRKPIDSKRRCGKRRRTLLRFDDHMYHPLAGKGRESCHDGYIDEGNTMPSALQRYMDSPIHMRHRVCPPMP